MRKLEFEIPLVLVEGRMIGLRYLFIVAVAKQLLYGPTMFPYTDYLLSSKFGFPKLSNTVEESFGEPLFTFQSHGWVAGSNLRVVCFFFSHN